MHLTVVVVVVRQITVFVADIFQPHHVYRIHRIKTGLQHNDGSSPSSSSPSSPLTGSVGSVSWHLLALQNVSKLHQVLSIYAV